VLLSHMLKMAVDLLNNFLPSPVIGRFAMDVGGLLWTTVISCTSVLVQELSEIWSMHGGGRSYKDANTGLRET
jgi:hypothetical protein